MGSGRKGDDNDAVFLDRLMDVQVDSVEAAVAISSVLVGFGGLPLLVNRGLQLLVWWFAVVVFA